MKGNYLKKWEGSRIITSGPDWVLLGHENHFLALEVESSKEIPSNDSMVIDIEPRSEEGYDIMFVEPEGARTKITVAISEVLSSLQKLL